MVVVVVEKGGLGEVFWDDWVSEGVESRGVRRENTLQETHGEEVLENVHGGDSFGRRNAEWRSKVLSLR